MGSKITREQIRAALLKQGTPVDSALMKMLEDQPHPDPAVRAEIAKDVAASAPVPNMDFNAMLGDPYEPTDEDMAGQMDARGRVLKPQRLWAPSGPAITPKEAMAAITFPASGPSPKFAPSAPPQAAPDAMASLTWPASGPSPKFAPSAPQKADPAAMASLTWPASGPAPKPTPAMPPQAKRNPDRLDDAIMLVMRGGR